MNRKPEAAEPPKTSQAVPPPVEGHSVIRVERADWEAANPKAQAFLKSALEQEDRLRNQGSICGP